MRRVGTLLCSRVTVVALAVVAGSVSVAHAQTSEPVTFTDDIRPIFERSCWNCHGAASQLSGLDLRTRDTAITGGARGPALVPGRGEESRLYRVLAGLDGPKMPMGGGAVSEVEVAAVRAWIDDGAHWDGGGAPDAEAVVASLEHAELPTGARDYWAFKLPEKARVPASSTYQHPVDRFLEAARRDAGVSAAPRADRLIRLRRAYLDLTGLPPTPAQTDAFLADTERGAWERVIEELLASPHYGERWGRHWMDVARYADSTGFEQDYNRPNAWRYRDYVIDAFNRDKPYSQFIREQIAGDELDHVTDETLIATGFLRAGPRVQFREKDNPERRHDYLDDVLATVGRGVLGMTVQCARCHNHKFDPILQRDYYSLQASIFGYVETDWPLLDRDAAAAYRAENAAVDVQSEAIRVRIREIEAPHRHALLIERIRRDFPDNVLQAAIKSAEDRTPGEALLADQVLTLGVPQQALADALTPDEFERRLALQADLDAVEATRPPEPPMAEIVTDGDYRFAPDGPGDEIIGCVECRIPPDEPGTFLYEEGGPSYKAPPSYFLSRGDPLTPTEPSTPGFLTVATYGDPPTHIPREDGRTSGRRLALAEWLTAQDNPLTARVMVNRIWHHHFGRGIVRTLDNLGQMGELPTHPKLLDWLAVQFMDRGWSIKEMHRLLMTSEAYQMVSGHDDQPSYDADPDNTWLWRFRQQRLEAEALRDTIMTVSGGIDLTVGGPPIFPYVPEEVLKTSEKGVWRNQPDGPEVWRRSVYVYRRRSLGFPFFDTFDLPDQNQTAASRNVTTVATQALTLMNNEFVLNQAELFAARLEQVAPGNLDEQVDLAYRIALTRTPTAEEAQIAKALVSEQSLADLTHVILNLNEFLYLR
ncbi:MAG: PSD1 and planctomycete cytochrome C domain-containing protein [bacterium]